MAAPKDTPGHPRHPDGRTPGHPTVWAIAAAHRPLLLTGVGLGLCGVAASLGQPLAIGALIEAAGTGGGLLWPIALMGVLFCADAAFSALHAHLVGRAGEGIVYGVRRSLIGRLLRADLAAYEKHQQGDLFTRMVTDTSVARIALTQSLAQLLINGFMVAGGAVLMFFIDVRLMLLTLGCLTAASAVSVLVARRLRRAAVRNREDTGVLGSDLQRVLTALPTVKASRAETREQHRIAGHADRARRSGVEVSALNALLIPTMNIGMQISLAVVFGVGMSWVATGAMSLATLTAFVLYLFYMVSPLVMFFLAIGQFQQGRAAIQRVDELFSLPQEETARLARKGRREEAGRREETARREETENGRARPHERPAPEAPAVEFSHVTYAYGDAGDALTDVSLTVPAHGLTAVVGPSGAGKTTLFQLIERFYHPQDGVIRIGGHDIAELPLDRLRNTVGYVQQDSAAMRGTLRDNLVYANPDATDEEIHEAVATADLTDVVDRLPEGLDTPLGEQGSGLSGGQRQRLCIARTLLQKPAVMLLDEATSHLDSDSETAFRRALKRVSTQCAVIAIAHRISTVADADRIVVLDRGRVRDIGSHPDLMARDPLYRRLADSQLRPEPEPPAPPVPDTPAAPPRPRGTTPRGTGGANGRPFIPAQRRRT